MITSHNWIHYKCVPETDFRRDVLHDHDGAVGPGGGGGAVVHKESFDARVDVVS